MAAMSIFFHLHHRIKRAFGDSGSGSVTAFVRAIGVICQDNPHLSLHQHRALPSPFQCLILSARHSLGVLRIPKKIAGWSMLGSH
jgi:hypothetical protein